MQQQAQPGNILKYFDHLCPGLTPSVFLNYSVIKTVKSMGEKQHGFKL